MMTFKYDNITLIKLVKSRPCLWDRNTEEYKNKQSRLHAWTEIYNFLEENYEDLSDKEKKEIGEKISLRWANIRDAFIRSLKAQSSHGQKRPYIYSDHLQFLLKCFKREDNSDCLLDDESYITMNSSNAEFPECAAFPLFQIDPGANQADPVNKHSHKKSKKVSGLIKKLDNIEIQILAELKHMRSSDSERFFQSFIPYLKDMTDYEKIELQMEILKSIKNIKLKRGTTLNLNSS